MHSIKNKMFLPASVFAFLIMVLIACNTGTPENNFSIAVLNSNMFAGFGGNMQLRELESPSAKLNEKDGTTQTMTRKEVLDNKIQYIEESYDKVKNLKINDDNKEIVTSSLELYEYILPVYKNEYTKLAQMYDGNAPQEQIQAMAQSINQKYYPGFKEKYDKLISNGKRYAEKHSIKVHWND